MKRHYVLIERKPFTPSEVVHPTLSLEECKACDDPCELRELFGQTTIGICEAEEEDLYALLVMSNDVLEPKTMLVVDYFEKKAKLYVGSSSDFDELKLKIQKAFSLLKKKELIITEIEDLRGGTISKSRRKIELNYVFVTYDNDEGGIKGSDILSAPFCVWKICRFCPCIDLRYGICIYYGPKTKIKDMQDTELNYTPEEAFKVIKNAYDETTSEKFENNLVESVSPEVRQIIITTKPFFTFDQEAVKTLLQSDFPKNNYMVSMFDNQIVITKTN